MKRKPIVYLICGFIGAGKTTFAKKLEEKTGAVRITKDEWSIRLIGNDPTIDDTAPLTGEAAQATLRGRPRGRLGRLGSGSGRVRGRPRGRLGRDASVTGWLRGRPRRLGGTHAGGATR